MTNKYYKGIFIIPFYDKDLPQLLDTISSVVHFTKEEHLIICLSDCKEKSNFESIHDYFKNNENIIVYNPPINQDWPYNTYGSLFCKKYSAMEYAIRNFEFAFFVNIDTDALVIGYKLFEYIENKFNNFPNAGILGSFKIRADGKKRTRWQWAFYILFLVYIKRVIPPKSLFWFEWIPLARRNGYRLGEHILGGAFVTNINFFKKINSIYSYDFLVKNNVHQIPIGDDVIFSLLVYVCGYKIIDFGRPEDPLCIAQNYLPINKDEIIRSQKQLIHSLKKGFHDESDYELRSYFRKLRNKNNA